MATLDRTRPYATVYGPSFSGHQYEQDGLLFDTLGNLFVTEVEPAKQAMKKILPQDVNYRKTR